MNAAMPDYVGFVFAHSRRHIPLNTARGFRERLDTDIQAVGVSCKRAGGRGFGNLSRGRNRRGAAAWGTRTQRTSRR